MYTSGGFRFLIAEGTPDTSHVWLVLMKAMRALTRYAAADIEETGLGLLDFGVLRVLLHKGPLPAIRSARLSI
jgi:MarR family 2-MHQ and catechol resistance regulon transcriptional repressor